MTTLQIVFIAVVGYAFIGGATVSLCRNFGAYISEETLLVGGSIWPILWFWGLIGIFSFLIDRFFKLIFIIKDWIEDWRFFRFLKSIERIKRG